MSPLEWLAEVHRQSPHLLRALLAGGLVSTVCGVVGCFIVLRRTSFLADALAHSMLAGVVCGYLVMKKWFGAEAHAPAMVLGSLIAGVLTVAMIGFVSRYSRVKQDAVIGIMYTGVFALGGVILSLNSADVHIDLYHFLTGQLLAIQTADLWMMAAVAGGVLAAILLCFRQLQLVSFDPVMAASIGVPVLAMEYLLTTCTSLVVVAGVNVVGVILVVGLLIIPAATAYLLCDRLSRMVVLAAGLGLSSFLAGYLWSETQNIGPGSAVVVASAAQFLVVLAVAPRYGLLADWRRRRRSVPLPLQEDVLGSVLRSTDERATLAELTRHLEWPARQIERAVRGLVRRELLREDAGALRLTEPGRAEAERLVRAHRLWETYLEHVGTPQAELHARAHHLEHVHDDSAIRYLDDKLGHPLQDPHGAQIPAPPELVVGAETTASELREGHEAEVLSVGEAAAGAGLRPGDRLRVGARRDEGRLWTFARDDGSWIELDHHGADEVRVRLLAS